MTNALGDESVGCPTLRTAVDGRLHVRLNVFGRIHEQRGKVMAAHGLSVNASIMDHRYVPVNPPLTVTLPD